jgi:hypothetical protein
VLSTDGTRETIGASGVVPLVGSTASQPPPEVVLGVAVKFKAPLLAAILTVWPPGVEPPVWYANVNELGVALIVGAVPTTSVTVTVGVLVAPVELTCTVPVYVPGVKLFGRMETLNEPGVLPPDAVAASQALPSVTEVVNGMVAPFEAVTPTFCWAGSDPRSTILKVSLVFESTSVGSGDTTTKVAGIVNPVLPVMAGVSVIEPL